MSENPLVSAIITTKNSASTLGACLESLRKQTYTPIEIIVVDNQSTDTTPDVSREYTTHVYDHGPERSAQRNFGVRKSLGTYVLIIDSDMVLSDGVITACVETLAIHPEYHALIAPEESFGIGFWAECKRLERSFYVGSGWMEGARFFRKSSFETVGGYDEENTGTEDFDLPNRLRRVYGDTSIGTVNAIIYHNEQYLSLTRTCQKKFYYSQRLAVYASREHNREIFYRQANPFSRYRLFFSRPKKLFEKPIIGIGMLFMKTCEFFSGGMGYLIGTYGKRSR